MNPEKTGNLIGTLRKEKNLTQQELADKIGVTRNAISRWETGKGYPDIEILPSLAESLSVSINELLNGEELPKEELAAIADQNLIYVCENVAHTKKRRRKKLVWLWIGVGITALIVTAILFNILCSMIKAHTDAIRGTKNCVIADDYSYITYFGDKYIPFDIEPYDCTLGEKVVVEAMVGDGSLAVKLPFFSDSLDSVKGSPDFSIVYLTTDYDFAPSEYYVKESEYDKVQGMLDNFTDTYFYALVNELDWRNNNECPLKGDYMSMLENVKALPADTSQNCTINAPGSARVPIICYEPNHIFYRTLGSIIYKDGEYYWFEHEEIDPRDTIYIITHPYPLDDQYDELLDVLFSYEYNYD